MHLNKWLARLLSQLTFAGIRGPRSVKRGRKHALQPRLGELESLEVRTLLAATTSLTLSGGNLVVTDVAGGGQNDTLTIQSDTTNSKFIISDPNHLLGVVGIAGAVVSVNEHSVTVPFSSVSGTQIQVNSLGGNDSLTIDLSLGVFSKSITFDGGTQTTSDSLTLTGGGVFSTVSHGFTNASTGTIDVSGNSQISYTGLEPVFDNLNATDRTFTFNGGAETITLTDGTAADGKTLIDSTLGESVYFKNPTNSTTINGGTSDDTVTITSVDAGFNAALTINGDAGADTVNLNGDITFANSKSLIVNTEVLNTGAGVDVVTSGSGAITVTADDVALNVSSTLVSAGTVTFATQTATRGITLGGSVAGQLSFTDAELDRITANKLLIGSGTSGAISVVSDISPGSVPTLHLTSGATILGGTVGGIIVGDLAISAAGTVDFRDASTNVINVAIFTSIGSVDFFDAGGLTVTTVDGVNGITSPSSLDLGSTGNLNVVDTPAADDIKTSNTLNITLGVSGAVFTTAAGSNIRATNNSIYVIADDMVLGGTMVVTAARLEPFTANTEIVLGTNPGLANTLELSNAELALISGTLRIGRDDGSASGDIKITAPLITRNLILRTGMGIIDANPIGNDISCPNLTLRTGTGVGASGADLTLETSTGNLAFLNTVSGNVSISNAGTIALADIDGFSVSQNNAGSVNVIANNSIFINSGIQISGAGNLTLTSINSDIQISGQLTANDGDITLQTPTNVIANSAAGGVSALDGNISITVDADHDGFGSILYSRPIFIGVGTATFATSNSNGSVTGVISGSGSIVKTGPGTLRLSNANTYTGTTTVNAGKLLLDGSINSNTIVASGGTLVGSGTIDSSKTLTVQSGGAISPGTLAGILNAGGTVLNSGSTFNVDLNGTTAGTGYDQLNVTGTVQLNNATLTGTLGYLPSVGDSFKLINNDSNDAVVGTFNGMAEGATFGSGLATFTITYHGGDGNDVVLSVTTVAGPDLAVTTTSDVLGIFDSQVSLRDAVAFANLSEDVNTITFAPGVTSGGPATFTLDSGVIRISNPLTISGPGADLLTIDGNNLSQIFYVFRQTGSTPLDVTLSGLTLAHGFVADEDGGAVTSYENLTIVDCILRDNTANEGGALQSEGTTTIRNTTFLNNSTELTGGGDGGAISNNGVLVVFDSTFTGNFAYDEGGVLDNNGTAIFINSTLSGNSANTAGGAINNQGDLTVINSTITLNRADADGSGSDEGVAGGGIRTDDDRGTARLFNSIIAGNVRGAIGADVPADLSVADPLSIGVEAISSNNLIGDPNSAAELIQGTNGNILGQDDGSGGRSLLPIAQILNTTLSNTGGTTLTHALIIGSAAINSGNDSFAIDPGANLAIGGGDDLPLTTDQRGIGFARPVGTVDIGAFEVTDIRPPTADIIDIAPDPRNINVGTVTVSFSESVTGIDIGDFILTRDGSPVSLSGVVLNGTGSTYTLDLSSQTGEPGTYILTLHPNGSSITDLTGNPLAADAFDVWTTDTATPTLDITPNGTTTNAVSVTFTFQFSETVTGFDASDINVTNGSKGAFTAVDDDTYTLVVTPGGDGVVSVSVDAGAATDAASNGNTAANASITSDRTLPTLAITPNGTLTNAAATTFTFQFSETVTGFDASDINVTNGSKGTFTAVDGDTYTLDVTPVADGVVSVSVDAAAANDAASNGNMAANASITSDRTLPTLAITPNGTLTNAAATTFTFQFSETVTGFDASDINVTNGSKGAFTAVDGDTYTLDVTPVADGVVSVSVDATAANDAASNGNMAANASITSDRTLPTLAITPNGTLTNSAATTITFQFSETVTGFDASDINVTNGAKGAFTAVDGDTYTLVVTPVADGVVSVSVDAAAANDAASNGNTAANASITSDRTLPTLAITPNGTLTNAAATTFTFQFSETVTGFDASDINVTNGSKGAFTAVDGDTYTLDVTPVADGVVSVGVDAAAANDAVSNGNTAANASITSDRTLPTLAITPNGTLTNAAATTFTFQFSETVTGFDASDVNVTNGTKGTFTAVDGDTYTLVVTPTADGTVGIGVNNGAASDVASNGNSPANTTIESDRTAPTLAITPNGTLTNAASTTLTFQFSETVTGFDASDVNVTNGTKGTFTAVDGDTFTLVVTPVADGPVMVDVGSNAANDAASNGNTPASASLISDRTAPTLAVTPDGIVTNSDAITFTFQFSETVTGFDASDINVINGSKGTFTVIDGNTYTLVVNPAVDGMVSASVTSNAAIDAASNGSAPASATITSDRTAPTLDISPNGTLTSSNSVLFTFQFSEAVTGFDIGDVHVTNGMPGALTVVDGATYTLMVTPVVDGAVSVNVDASAAVDIAANGTTAASATITSDRSGPVFSSAANPTVLENSASIQTVTANDAHGPVTFAISPGLDAGLFSLDATSGLLRFLTAPDFEVPLDNNVDNVYELRVQATDALGQTSFQEMTVTVNPVNDNPPSFTSSASFTIAENLTNVGTVIAVDADRPSQTVNFSITGGADAAKFNITSDGVLTFKSPADFESPADAGTDNVYDVTVTATDSGSPALTMTQNLSITVTNANENPTDIGLSPTSVDEQRPIGTVVGTLTTTDPDAIETCSYSLVSGSGGTDNASFRIAGDALQTNVVLNFIAQSSYSIRVRSTDAGGLSTEKVLTITANQVIFDLLNLNGPEVTWIKRQPPVTALPQLQVTPGINFAGGTLTINVATVGTKKKALDLLQIPAIGFGSSVQNTRTPTLTNIVIQLGQADTADAIQSFLKGITFATKGKGLKSLTRMLHVTLTDGIGHSSSITQTINVRKKAV